MTAAAGRASHPPAAGQQLQRVVVHVAVRSRGQLLLGESSVLPWAVLRHGESPGHGATRTLSMIGAPPVRTGVPLEIRHAVRIASGIDMHTVHIVLSAVVTDHAARDAFRRGRWVTLPDRSSPAGQLPLVPDAEVGLEAHELARMAPADGPGQPVLRQRLAAYAVVIDDDGRILLTRLSSQTPSPGRWTLPGGGVDHGEHPVDAAVREVHEETGMQVEVDGLADVGSEHFTGRSPRGVVEDFHALRVLVTATAQEVKTPQVLDVGGSTDLGQWAPLTEAPALGLVGVAHRGVQIALRRRRNAP